ncbi:MAG TPA: hypothetical protein VGN17_06620 [Bryobacteraceae bacterium]|jgi:hypothetical protein
MRRHSTVRIARAVLPLLSAFALVSPQAPAQQANAQQANRDAYRSAYKTWREAEPNLESDASAPAEALTGRATHAATEAVNFGAARAAFLRQLADDQGQNALWLQNAMSLPLPDFAPAVELQRLVGAETSNVNSTIATFSGDADRGIQQLRQALEKERAALAALDSAIADRQKAVDKAGRTEESFEPARAKAFAEYDAVTSKLLTPSAALADQENAAWAKYYPSLAAPTPAPVAVSSLTPSAVSAPATAPTAPRPGMPPLPLTRYTGVWVYPTTGGRFFGAEPEFVDFSIHEEDGRVTGELYARFKLPAGSTGDPVLRFDVSGELSEKRVQSFAIQTAEGAKGSIELIPGNAFNLLEINFQTEPSPKKVRAADLVLVKK